MKKCSMVICGIVTGLKERFLLLAELKKSVSRSIYHTVITSSEHKEHKAEVTCRLQKHKLDMIYTLKQISVMYRKVAL